MKPDSSKQKLLSQLRVDVSARLDGDLAKSVQSFADRFYRSFPAEDINYRDIADLYGQTYGTWHFMRWFNGIEPRVNLFNPNFEDHGWQSNHTVVGVLCENLPFCMASVRGELNRRDIVIHTLHSENFQVIRDDSGEFLSFANGEELSGNVSNESLLYLEIDRHSDESLIREIQATLVQVLAEVKIVVADFQPMLQQASVVAEQATANGDNGSQIKAFMDWLSVHFTFLGYEVFTVDWSQSDPVIERDENMLLGLCTIRNSHGAQDLSRDIAFEHDAMEKNISRQLVFCKSSERSRVHRTVYPDCVLIKEFDNDGRTRRYHRFLGLFASRVYTQSPFQIPVIAEKVSQVVVESGLDKNSHEGRELERILEFFPRDELFQSNIQQLTAAAVTVNQLKERRKVRLIVRPDFRQRFLYCLVYIPRDRFNTQLRLRVQQRLSEALHAVESDFETSISESVLARTLFTLRVDVTQEMNYDIQELEQEIIEATLYWPDQLRELLIEEYGEERGAALAMEYGQGFSPGYQDDFSARVAITDLARALTLEGPDDLALHLYHHLEDAPSMLRFRLYRQVNSLPLSDVLPILEHLGLHVIKETPYELTRREGAIISIQDFVLKYSLSSEIKLEKVKQKFQEAFSKVWFGEAESDDLNKLLLATQLDWREIAMLRAYTRYMKQIQFGYTIEFIAQALANNFEIACQIVRFFSARFSPQENVTDSQAAELLREKIIAAADKVENLSEDRVIRQFLLLIEATVRTNFYQHNDRGELHSYFSFKLEPRQIPDIPKPRPRFEIFVYSPRVEGVHLRGGNVARGGLRWSDRMEDYRTEVLGLVKAQQVKNAVIVPVGAKGGFVCKQMPNTIGRDEMQEEAIACYRLFIQGLLDVTDNIQDNTILPPMEVVRKDGDDTYLVVAADKGTATFSDIANEISEDRNFWLGDAFASGGQYGYDHKKMGITARGAWVSVQRHFREMDINIQCTDFSVVGIGDMGGDVFGNGMLLSEHTCLVAAFNHIHIFVDPSPDPEASFLERKRLFELPRSSWADYENRLISQGGGIFSRSTKAIEISAEMRQRFEIDATVLTPDELISALLKASVDLLWNGGIGTYVKASSESNGDVGDKANDALRVDACDLNCKVIGEGGNLGFSQLARIEYALSGGRINTDFIDNAAGVDCSDHEVNIKILLNSVIASGELTTKQRNRLLSEMTDSVATSVLKNNYRQVQAISLAEKESLNRIGEYRRLINDLVDEGKLDRALEFMPDDETLNGRKSQGQSLTRPELSVLISYSKGLLKEGLIKSELADDDYLVAAVETAFPEKIITGFKQQLYLHPLKREIVSTQIANDLINRMGVNFIPRICKATGASVQEVATAYIIVRELFEVADVWAAIEGLDFLVPADLQTDIMLDIVRLIRRASRWLIRNRRAGMDPGKIVEKYCHPLKQLSIALPDMLRGHMAEAWQQRRDYLQSQGVPEEWAKPLAGYHNIYPLLGIIDVSSHAQVPFNEVAQMYYALSERLELDWFTSKIKELKVDNDWQAIAREAYLDDLEWQQRKLAVGALRHMGDEKDVDLCIDRWMQEQKLLIDRWQRLITDMHAMESTEHAIFAVAIRELMDLAQSSNQ